MIIMGDKMKSKLLGILQIGVTVFGWLLLAGVLAGVWGRVVIYDRIENAAAFDFAGALDAFFSGLASAFLAFLVAAVVRMIQRESPAGNETARRVMIVCCLSYAASALVRIHVLASSPIIAPQVAKGFGWMLTYSLTAVLSPILYAASIYVLYTHFTRMVEFESEVA